jgi:CheY-like chemotaxis protein
LLRLGSLSTVSIDPVPDARDKLDQYSLRVGGVISAMPRILLVDDEPMVLTLFARALRDEGYEVVEAGDGLTGLELALAAPQPFDLVITDNRMKGMQGPELARRLRELQPGLPILHLSGSRTDSRDVVGETLFKPFDISELAQAVRRLLPG